MLTRAGACMLTRAGASLHVRGRAYTCGGMLTRAGAGLHGRGHAYTGRGHAYTDGGPPRVGACLHGVQFKARGQEALCTKKKTIINHKQ